MSFIWHYDINELRKSNSGRIKILERQINYGVYASERQKISLKLVIKYWDQLKLEQRRKRLFEFLIWGK